MFGGMCKVDERVRNWRSAFHGSKVIKSCVELWNSVYSYAVNSLCLLEFGREMGNYKTWIKNYQHLQ